MKQKSQMDTLLTDMYESKHLESFQLSSRQQKFFKSLSNGYSLWSDYRESLARITLRWTLTLISGLSVPCFAKASINLIPCILYNKSMQINFQNCWLLCIEINFCKVMCVVIYSKVIILTQYIFLSNFFHRLTFENFVF